MGLGWMEIGAIMIVAMLLFGPDRLPGLARQAAQFVKVVRRMAEDAKADLSRELGDDFKDVNLRDLDPRAAVRDALFADPAAPSPPRISTLRPDEVPPFDVEAT